MIRSRSRWLSGLVLLAVLLATGFAGCSAGLTPEERARMTPEQQIYEIQVVYNGALETAVAYASQPRCTESLIVGCYDTAVVALLARSSVEINAALEAARNAGDAAAQVAAATLVRRLLAEFQAQLLAGGVR